jgi:hypothetical protein
LVPRSSRETNRVAGENGLAQIGAPADGADLFRADGLCGGEGLRTEKSNGDLFMFGFVHEAVAVHFVGSFKERLG